MSYPVHEQPKGGGYPPAQPPEGAYPPPAYGMPQPDGGNQPQPYGQLPPGSAPYPPAPYGQPPPGSAPYPPGVPTGVVYNPAAPGSATTVVVGQPGQPGAQGQIGWMPVPQAPNDCPPGLEYLTQVDQVLVQQTVELLEAFTNIECTTKFNVKNTAGQTIYYAAEESGFCTRQCCGTRRGFTMHMSDNTGREVMRATREFKCFAGCGWCACISCCAYEVMIEAPLGTPIGYVKQACAACSPTFEIQDANHETVLKLNGPCACCMCECPCFDINFDLNTLDGEEVGKVSKQWTGLIKEMFTEADNFGITFPMDLDVKLKGALIGAVFLINMMFFEKQDNKHD